MVLPFFGRSTCWPVNASVFANERQESEKSTKSWKGEKSLLERDPFTNLACLSLRRCVFAWNLLSVRWLSLWHLVTPLALSPRAIARNYPCFTVFCEFSMPKFTCKNWISTKSSRKRREKGDFFMRLPCVWWAERFQRSEIYFVTSALFHFVLWINLRSMPASSFPGFLIESFFITDSA